MTQLKSFPLEDGQPLEALNTEQLIRVMIKVQHMRHDAVENLRNLTAKAAMARRQATTAHAKAFLRHEGPQAEREQVARDAAAPAKFAAETADGEIDACKTLLYILKDDWDTCRSANTNQRAEKSATDGFGS